MEEVLVVDGYNIIGEAFSTSVLEENDLEKGRDWLIEKLAEYQGFTGTKVYLIFDAHMVQGIGKKLKQKRLEIIFTKENETADERIEKLVREIKRVQRRIYVATSDHTEQWVVFGQGALRKSARELLIELNQVEGKIKHTVQEKYKDKPKSKFPLNPEMAELFEKWRRGK
ncbi:NYN domain-containing protein [Bacillus horti]|uniref:RNA-binding protein with PIN domain n=1 Tax=Caldalkalibacillus horti TaxID=77523 RepID=A0ABT9VYI4_9BACI|nr:NYN domain-containing protein [Bacillus horti]MDQ0166046.1 putative RNA-binding protein with PIN domain [Bacillus horti]